MPSIFRTTKTILRAASIAVAGLVFSGPNAADAGLYDAHESRPGDEVINTIIGTHGASGQFGPFVAKNRFTVMPIETPARLRAFHYAPTGKAVELHAVHPTEFSSSATAAGPFLPSVLPQQDGQVIPLDSPIPLEEATRILRGIPLFFLLEDAGLNLDSAAIDTVVLETRDYVTGDFEFLKLYETGPDTGIFAGYICTCGPTQASSGDGTLTTVPHSRIDGIFQDPFRGERRLEDDVLVGPVDPYGLIFDSRTGAPLDGVEITIIDETTGLPATVYGEDLISIYPSTIVTGSSVSDSSGQTYDLDTGGFRFPFVDVGQYRFEVSPPRGYIAPSTALDSDMQALPDAPFALKEGSRLETFTVAPGPAIEIDIPMDGSALINVTRTGSADLLEIGDMIEYTVTAGTNVVGDLVADIIDRLPVGIKVVEASISVEGQPNVKAIISADGRHVVFDDVTLPNRKVARITYVARVTPAARENATLISSSTADAPGFISNTAEHALDVLPAFRRDENIVIGQIFGNGCTARFDPELDLSGIRVMMENGRFAQTDAEGLFTFRSMPRGTHVLAIDPLSLPRGYELKLCTKTTRTAGSAGSTFVSVSGGLMNQVYFHIEKAGDADDTGRRSAQVNERDPRPKIARFTDYDQAWLDEAPVRTEIVFPEDNRLAASRNMAIAVLHRSGEIVSAEVNGTPVDGIHARPALTSASGAAQLASWSGSGLKDGKNELHIVVRTLTGDVVLDERRTVYFVTEIHKMEILEERSDLTSNGRDGAQIVLRLSDKDGVPLHPGTRVTIATKAPFGFLNQTSGPDGSSRTLRSLRTTRSVDDDGLMRLSLAPSTQPGTLVLSTDGSQGEVSDSAFVGSENRPWMLVGLAEGTAAHQSVMSHIEPIGNQQIAQVGDIEIGGRVAFYAQGVIRGKWLATMRYDSAISPDTRDFFAEDPDAAYIVYGDTSTEGDAAQSRHPLYLRLEGDKVDLLYGDFDTYTGDGLASYSRRLTGARAILGDERSRVIVFAAEAVQSFAEDSFRANGTSGPFDLTHGGIIAYSDRVMVETTARNDPQQIIETRELERGRDYDIDYNTGRIFLSEPLLGRTASLDFNTLVVQYEIEADGADGIIAGARIEHELREGVRVGATIVHEDNIAGSNGAGQMAGVDVEIDLGSDWTARLDLAATHQEASDAIATARTSHAAEISLGYETDRSSFNAYVRSQDSTFGIDNTTETREHLVAIGTTADLELARDTIPSGEGEIERIIRATGEARFEENLDTGERTGFIEGLYVRETDGLTRGGGLRALGRRTVSGTADDGAYGIKAVGLSEWESQDERLRLSFGQEITLFKSGDIGTADRGTIEIEYDLTEDLMLKATNEIVIEDGIQGNLLGLGFEYRAWEGATLDLGILDARAPGSDILVGYAGLTQELQVSEAWTLEAGIERQGAFSGSLADTGPFSSAGIGNNRLGEAYTSLFAGASFADEGQVFSTRIEQRFGAESDSTRFTADYTHSMQNDVEIGLGASFYRADTATGEELDHSVKGSIAWRPRDARYALLDQIEIRREKAAAADQLRLINSTYYSRQIGESDELMLRGAVKYAQFNFSSGSYDDVLALVGAEYRHDLSESFDIGLHGAAMRSVMGGNTEYSAGASLGITPFKNGWVSLGYNFAGFKDDDFSAGGYTDKGLFLQFRMKIDSSSLAH